MPRGIEIDWVVVRIHTIRRIIAIAVTAVLTTVLLAFAYNRMHLPPQAVARKAIEQAEHSQANLEEKGTPQAWRSEAELGAAELEDARSAYTREEWEEAARLARQARQRFEAILGIGTGEVAGAGQIFSLKGRVSVQRAGKTAWEPARERMPLFNGDFVRTGNDGSAEILLADGTIYRVAPDSLLEIHHQARTSSEGKVKMVVGRLKVFTASSASTVATDATETSVERDSRVAVDVNSSDRRTVVAAYAGRARVRGRGGSSLVLHSQERVAAAPDGKLGTKGRIPAPPRPVSPENNVSFDLSEDPVITLEWALPPGTVASHLQVSRSSRFPASALDVDDPARSKNTARLKGILRGTYYWRVAALDEEGVSSEWSPVRRFRLTTSGHGLPMEDHTPPELEVEPARQMGQLFIIEGRTEVGATVTINDEPVDVDADGHFRKAIEVADDGWNDLVVAAVDPAGNRTERRQRVFVEVY